MVEVKGVLIFEEFFEETQTKRFSYRIETRTTTLSDITNIYSEGIGAILTSPRNTYPEGHRFFQATHETKYTGHWHLDAIQVLRDANSRFSEKQPTEAHIPAIYFKKIKGFRTIDFGLKWTVEKSEQTKEFFIWMPPEGIIVPTPEGEIYHKFTGVPRQTVKDIEEAIGRWVRFGLTEDEARREISMFYVGAEEGLYLAGSWSGGQNGPLCIDLKDRPGTADLKYLFA